MREAYAVYHTDSDIRTLSSSGGVFTLFAEKILKAGGIIYGVAMAANCYWAEFVRVCDFDDLHKLRGSKYLQAKLGNTLRDVKKDLEEGRCVLFSGTGCQINGLKMFLGKEYAQLVCVEVVCHGAPSPKLWEKYVQFQEAKYGKLVHVNFRCKERGWKQFGMKENQTYIPKGEDPFMNMFLDDYCLRPACYECHAKKFRLSDISIADFWGIEAIAPEMNDGQGTSLVIVRSDKGKQLFEETKGETRWKLVDYTEAVKANPAEYASAARPPQRDTFFADLEALSFEIMIKKYATARGTSLLKTIARKAKNKLRKIRGGVKTNANYGLLFTFQQRNK